MHDVEGAGVAGHADGTWKFLYERKEAGREDGYVTCLGAPCRKHAAICAMQIACQSCLGKVQGSNTCWSCRGVITKSIGQLAGEWVQSTSSRRQHALPRIEVALLECSQETSWRRAKEQRKRKGQRESCWTWPALGRDGLGPLGRD